MREKVHTLPLYVLFLIAFTTEAASQHKFERESGIPEKYVPAPALEFLGSIPGKGKVKWYLEESLEDTSIEAKFKRQGKRYSIEFDSLGKLQDIEVQIKFEEIPPGTSDKILSNLENRFEHFKIDRIQVQYRGDPSVLLALVKNETPKNMYFTNYEMVIRGKDKTGRKLYEGLFNSDGRLESLKEIIQRNTDNLEF